VWRCQQWCRSRTANSGQVFNEQTINLELPTRFYVRRHAADVERSDMGYPLFGASGNCSANSPANSDASGRVKKGCNSLRYVEDVFCNLVDVIAHGDYVGCNASICISRLHLNVASKAKQLRTGMF
jgi:hypothetical protein